MLLASVAATFSPMATTIYLPALNEIAGDLHVDNSLINLTVTTFLVRLNCLTLEKVETT